MASRRYRAGDLLVGQMMTANIVDRYTDVVVLVTVPSCKCQGSEEHVHVFTDNPWFEHPDDWFSIGSSFDDEAVILSRAGNR